MHSLRGLKPPKIKVYLRGGVFWAELPTPVVTMDDRRLYSVCLNTAKEWRESARPLFDHLYTVFYRVYFGYDNQLNYKTQKEN